LIDAVKASDSQSAVFVFVFKWLFFVYSPVQDVQTLAHYIQNCEHMFDLITNNIVFICLHRGRQKKKKKKFIVHRKKNNTNSDVTTSTEVLCWAARIAETIIAGRPTYIKFTQAVNKTTPPPTNPTPGNQKLHIPLQQNGQNDR